MFLKEHSTFKLEAYLWFLDFPKVEWEAELSVIMPLHCGTISTFKVKLKTSHFDEVHS